MKRHIIISAIIIVFAIVVVIPSVGRADWQTTKPLSENILCTEWVNVQIGYLGTAGKIYKTTNGGSSWLELFTASDTWFESIEFRNAQTGYATAGAGIYKTTNSGANWTLHIVENAVASLNSFCFVDDQTIFGINSGSGYNAYKSTNAGVNWTGCEPRVSGIPVGISYSGNKLLFAYRDSVYTSTNLGATWNVVPFFKGQTYSLCFNNGVTFWGQYASDGAKILRSTNEGMSWTTISGSGTIDKVTLISMAFVNSNTGYAVGYKYENNVYLGVAYKTTDNGLTWVLVQQKAGVKFNNVTCTSEKAIIGADSGYLITCEHSTGVNQISTAVPSQYKLGQNYPNPFNPVTYIEFSIVKSGNVKITVYNLQGKEVAVLLNEVRQVGTHKTDFIASNLPSGTYFYRLETEGFSQTKKMTLVK